MAPNDDNPRDRVPGTRSRFRFPNSDTGFAFIGPAIVLMLVLLVGLYAMSDWIGGNTKNPQPSAVAPDAWPQSPSNK